MTTRDERRTVSRRRFFKVAGMGAAGAAAFGSSPLHAQNDRESWDHTADVIVVGSGCAGLTAAASALEHGASAIVLEKGPVIGGTTGKSHGAAWIPNNSLMRADGLSDPREDALRYMARLSFPDRYRPGQANYGIPEDSLLLMGAFYDNASRVTDALIKIGAWHGMRAVGRDGQIVADYFAHLAENKAPRGRVVNTDMGGTVSGFGGDMVHQLRSYCESKGATFLLEHRATRIVRAADGRVSGIVADTGNGVKRFRARKGVIFGSGGFALNRDLCSNYLRMPLSGASAVPQNEGDLIPMAIEIGAKLGTMNEAWLHQVILEEALQTPAVPNPVFVLGGDSMVTVNKNGVRIYDEKFVFNERTRTHFSWDAQNGEYTNLYQFFIYDQRAADIKGQTIPPNVRNAPYVIKADTLDALAAKIEERLVSLEPKIGVFRLNGNFLANLKNTIAKFNEYAATGDDLEFKRGTPPVSAHYNPPHATNKQPNRFMYPISGTGPYYCVIIAPGAVDTKGGPATNASAQVLDTHDVPIPGLYAAGNCAASPSGQAFWAAGATLGLALTFGYMAGEHAAAS